MSTISLIATIEQVLGLSPIGLYDGLAAPMTDVFDSGAPASFTFEAEPSNFLLVGTFHRRRRAGLRLVRPVASSSGANGARLRVLIGPQSSLQE